MFVSYKVLIAILAGFPLTAAVTLSGASQIAGPNAGNGTVSIVADQAWTAASSDTWLTVSPASGTGNQVLTFNYSSNASFAGRMATITVSGKQFVVSQLASNGAAVPWSAVPTTATLPEGVGVDGNGNIYIPDATNHVVRKLTAATGQLTTIAGTGAIGSLGDGGLATAATLQSPRSVAVDPAGNVFIADDAANRVRRIDALTGIITTYAGTGLAGSTGDGGPASAALLRLPYGVAVDTAGNLYIADLGNQRIRKVTASTGTISNVAGTGLSGFSGDGAAAISAQLFNPTAVAVDGAGNVYIADTFNHRIRKVTVSTGFISTLAGTGSTGLGGDGAAAIAAQLDMPRGVAVDPAGDVYIADSNNQRVRKITVANGNIATFAVTGIANPSGVAVDGVGHVYVSDTTNNRVLFFNVYTPAVTLNPTSASATVNSGTGIVNIMTTPAGASWTAATSASWLTLGATSGTGATALTYTFTDNPTSANRTAVIVVNGATLTVTQSSPSLSAGSASVAPTAGSASFSLIIPPAVNWTASSSASWLTVTPPSGTGSAAITFNFTANPGTVGRMATITVAGRSFVVTQPAVNGMYPPWNSVGNGAMRDLATSLNQPAGVAADGNGNVYIADSRNNSIARIDAVTGAYTIVAQSPEVNWPKGVATDRLGNVYVADTNGQRIRKIAGGTGAITTVAGGGLSLGDGGPATSALLLSPPGVAVDALGNIFVADANDHRIRRIDAVTGIISTYAGTGTGGVSGDGGPAVLAQIADPWGVALDEAGNLYFSDYLNNRIRRVDAATGIITTVAGTGLAGFGGDGGQATSAWLKSPRGIAVNAAGDVFIADNGNGRVRKLTVSTGVINTVASASAPGMEGVAVDPAGNILIADTLANRVRFVDLETPVVTLSAPSANVPTIAGTGSVGITTVPAGAYWSVTSNASWLTPAVTSGAGTTLSYSFTENPTLALRTAVLTINGKTHTVAQAGASISASTIFLGPGASSGTFTLTTSPSAAWSATSSDTWLTVTPSTGTGSGTFTYSVTANPGPNGRTAVINVAGRAVFVSQSAANGSFSPWGVTGYGIVKTIAGTGAQGSSGDGGPATSALLKSPYGVAVDANGNVYIADTDNNRVRKVAAGTGIITTIAGTGIAGFSGDGGSATLAKLNAPKGIGVDEYGNVYVADALNNRVRRISTATGIISTLAGTGDVGGGGDGGPAASAQLNNPYSIAVAANRDVFIGDANNQRIRRVDSVTGAILPVAWNIPAVGLAVDGVGNVYAANYQAHMIQRIDAATGVVTPFAGTGVAGFSGDGGAATAAKINSPRGLTIDAAGNVYVSDYGNNRIRVIDAATGNIRTLAGTGQLGGTGDGGPATQATIAAVEGIAVDGGGNVFIADTANSRIRFIDYSSVTVSLSANSATAPSAGGTGSVNVTTVPGTNSAWSVTGAPSWLTVTIAGNAVNWSAAANNTGSTRTATLIIGDKTYSVSQSSSSTVAPQLVSVTPALAATATQVFNITARDPNGYTDIGRIYFLLNSSTAIPANSCHGYYDRAANAVFLYNDALTALSAPLTPGAAGAIQNSQCAISGAGSSATGAGLDVVLNLSVTRQGAYSTGALNLYLWVTDLSGLGTGWVSGSTWTVGGGPVAPTLASATPSSTTSATQTFAITARDLNGAADLSRIYFLVNSNTTIPTNSCHGFYDRAANAFFLYNDALTALAGPLTPGAAGSIGNSQCAIDGPTSSVSSAGTDVVLNMNLTRRGIAAFGTMNLYLWITDNEAAGTGWVQASAWTLPLAGPQPPVLAAASPGSATGVSQVFTLTARDPNGASDIARVYFLLNSSTAIPTGTCHGYYDRGANLVFLYNDQLTATTSLLPGSSTVIQNSQCAINGVGTTVSSAGTDLVLNLNMARMNSYATGSRSLYVWITDNAAAGTGWVAASSWVISVAQQPAVIASASPASSTSLTQSFSIVVRDVNGSAETGLVFFLVHTNAVTSPGTCYGYYNPYQNLIQLLDDAQTNLTSITPGTPGTIQNSSCSIDGVGSSATVFGTDIALTLRITRQGPAATGIRTLFVNAGGSGSENSSGWVPVSTWTIAPVTAYPPTVAAATPSAATTATQTFTITARDLDGFAQIDRVYFLINTNPTIPLGTCHGYYERRQNAFFLYDNGLLGLAGPLTPGTGTIQNSQCTINGNFSAATGSGTDLTMSLSVTRTGAYSTGALNLYIWVTDTTGAGSGWIQASSWTL